MYNCISLLLIVYASILFSVVRERWFINVVYVFLCQNSQLIIFMNFACIWVCVLCTARGMWIRIYLAGLFQNDLCNFLSCDFLSALQQMMGFVVERITLSLHFWYCICCICFASSSVDKSSYQREQTNSHALLSLQQICGKVEAGRI